VTEAAAAEEPATETPAAEEPATETPAAQEPAAEEPTAADPADDEMITVEVIDDGEDLKVLEIDARIPSQTPIAVLKSSGMNLLKELADVTLYGEFRDENTAGGCEKIFCAYENYRRTNGVIVKEGEHIMRNAKPLVYRENFLGSMETMTDWSGDEADFRGIFINWGEDKNEVLNWRNTLLHSQKD
jgi:pyrrolysine biosynthesis protein PylC